MDSHSCKPRKANSSPHKLFVILSPDRQGHAPHLLVEVCVELGRDLALGLEHLVHERVDVLEDGGLGGGDVRGRDLVEVPLGGSKDNDRLLLDGHGLELRLLEDLGQAGAALQDVLSGGVKVRAELRKGGDLTVLGELQLEGTGDLLHPGELRGGSDAGHGQTDVEGRADPLVEQLSLQEDLAVGNRNHVGGNVGRHITWRHARETDWSADNRIAKRQKRSGLGSIKKITRPSNH